MRAAAPDDDSIPALPDSLRRHGSLKSDAGSPDDQDDGGTRTDLFGNDVLRAVATYKVDDTGSLYELHSPHTELPRLGVPKS